MLEAGDRRYVKKTRFDRWGDEEREALDRAMLQHAPAIGAVEKAEARYCLLNELFLQEVRGVAAARKVIETRRPRRSGRSVGRFVCSATAGRVS